MPPSRLPTVSDLPSSFNAIIHPSPTTIPPSSICNIILFLPGLGDTSSNFSSFPHALNLPDTLNITLQPPFPLPFGLTPTPAYHWSDDLSISSTGDLDATESGFTRSVKLIADMIVDVLIKTCGFQDREIHLFGSGQGGSLALSVPLHELLTDLNLGSVVSVGGPLPLSTPDASVGAKKNGSPVLVLGGSRGVVFGGSDDGEGRGKRIRDRYGFVEVERWKKGDDGMPKNREEVLPLMRFWARRLRNRRGVPGSAVEIG